MSRYAELHYRRELLAEERGLRAEEVSLSELSEIDREEEEQVGLAGLSLKIPFDPLESESQYPYPKTSGEWENPSLLLTFEDSCRSDSVLKTLQREIAWFKRRK